MRSQPDFREASSRQIRVIGIEGGPEGWSSAAVLVRDEFRNYNEVDPELWQRDMADVEWNLIGQALRQPPSLVRSGFFLQLDRRNIEGQRLRGGLLLVPRHFGLHLDPLWFVALFLWGGAGLGARRLLDLGGLRSPASWPLVTVVCSAPTASTSVWWPAC